MNTRFASLATLGLALLAAAKSPDTLRAGINTVAGLIGRKLDQDHVNDFARYASTAADAISLVVPSLRGLAPAQLSTGTTSADSGAPERGAGGFTGS